MTMPKETFTEQIEKLELGDLIASIARTRGDLTSRWTNGKLYGASVRNTSILEHRQVLCYDRLLDELLGPGWEEDLDFIEYISRWIQKKKEEYWALQNKIG